VEKAASTGGLFSALLGLAAIWPVCTNATSRRLIVETADLSHHILSRYNADLEGVRTGVLQMGGLVEQQLQNGVRALVTESTAVGEKSPS
jgi:hypothetical protein